MDLFRHSLEVEVSPSVGQGNAQLSIVLKNTRSTDLRMFSGSLPWVDGVSGMRLTAYVATRRGGNQVMKPLRSVGALLHGQQEVTIPPGGSLAGFIELEQRFPGIDARLARETIVIFWRYVPAEVDPGPPSELSGAVLLQKP